VAVVAVAGEDVVVRPQGRERADGDRLLPDVEMTEAADLAERVRLGRLLLEAADENHLVEHLQKGLAVYLVNLLELLLLPLLVLLRELGRVDAVALVAPLG
jgi:hypothetical protein